MALTILSSVTDSNIDYPRDVYVEGNYAYVTSYISNSLTIIDVSDTQNPEIVGQIVDSTKLNKANKIEVSGDYAYVSIQNAYTYGKPGMAVVDISNKTSPSVLSYVFSDTNISSLESIFITKRESFIFVTGNSSSYDYILVFNVKNPDDIVYVGRVSVTGSNISDLEFLEDGSLAISNDSGFEVFDFKNSVDNVFNFIKENSTVTPPFLDEDYAYIINEDYFYILDNSTGEEVGSLNDATDFVDVKGVIIVVGNYAFVRTGTKVISIDISDKSSPTKTDDVSVSYPGGGSGSDGTAYYYDSGYIYLPDSRGELRAVDISSPASLVLESGSSSGLSVRKTVVDGNYAYVYSGGYFRILNVSNKSSTFTQEDSYLNNLPFGFFKVGDYFYLIAVDALHRKVLDVSDVTNITEYGALSISDYTSGYIEFDGSTYLYAIYDDYLLKFEKEDVDTINFIGKVFIGYINSRVRVFSNLISLCDFLGLITVLNLNEFLPTETQKKLGSFTSAAYFSPRNQLSYTNNFLYVASYSDDSIVKLDVSDLSLVLIEDYIVSSSDLNTLSSLKLIEDYIFSSSVSDDKVLVVKEDGMVFTESLTDSTDLNGAFRIALSSSLKALFVVCVNSDSMVIIDASDYIVGNSTFTPKVMVI